ncbi:uncharacterized protein TEOVI_000255500 [Trypanosoma equiperdum]|uniref:Uncharacterized protein n=4 Tax=Trypanozoon TaxID=39700 RepID=Q38BJ1_TRYB2|nr:hypothetical protein, conserved [Trypanosoma brucei gambiense DAL972]XP_822657.1 hypothetical protein, conserved [Trypanosoma brucei brucei TREU927]RHW69917.1 hypothetical protein DPX39_100046700 [Trypanosoma brucei equiperdum]SCU70975.1 hypothetical protein, conserved [Trypanosoma equiperdum]EAN77829.1 hypothetical protein, conserved [Trypanosoma brucei brucei TREU927]CBH15424.1 hypothetical protein, conserved [Trypanosoma brucei gambiense DAL972]|eukprot:XP_011777688.1 hypothetical protein, conserved [Trypanosoma brucei gambiense DAL972]
MFLRPIALPLWVLFVTVATFFVLRALDPVDVGAHREKVYGLPPQVVWLFPLVPVCVWLCYEAIMLMAPAGSKVALKVYD